MVLTVRPTQPMINTSFGSSTCSRVMNLSRDWRKMLMPRASRKTPLKNAPSICALCQPNDKSCRDALRSETCCLLCQ